MGKLSWQNGSARRKAYPAPGDTKGQAKFRKRRCFRLVLTGAAPEAHAAPVPKPDADFAFEHAECIGCGACVAACPNGAAMLFTSAKINHLNVLPQGAPERETRMLDMVAQMDEEGFGGCSNTSECEAACPAGISVSHIARLNREYARAAFVARN